MRMHALINNAVVKHKVPGSFHLFSDAKRSLMKIKCGAEESDCTFIANGAINIIVMCYDIFWSKITD